MAFSERINLVIDVVTGSAKSQLAGIKSDMAQAEGAFNKAKAGIGGAISSIGQMAPAALAGAGAAIGAFALKSIDEFQKTALAADKFRDSTGLSLEESSKWIAVADDVGIGAETIQGALIKMEKAIGANRSAFGDLIVTAQDGSTDLNATILNVITHLQGIKDPIDRNTESAKLFGRGWAEVSELITTDAATLKSALEGVSDAQIIDEDEVRKARDYQAAMDELGDAFRDLSIAAGETLVPLATGLANAFAEADKATEKVGGIVNVFDTIAGHVVPAYGAIKNLFGALDEGGTKVDDLGTAAGFAGGEFVAAAGDMDLLAGATGAAGAQADQLKGKWQELFGTLSAEEATLNLADSFARVGETAAAAAEAAVEGGAKAETANRRAAQAVNDNKQQVVEYAQELTDLPPEVVSEILALIDQGLLAEAEAKLQQAARERQARIDAQANIGRAEAALDSLTRTRNMTINAQIVSKGGAGYGTGFRAAGGAVVPGGVYVMGEQGPEAMSWDASGRGRVTPAGPTSRMLNGSGGQGGTGGITVNVNVAPGGNLQEAGRQMVEALVAYERSNGNGWRSRAN